jgi:hypothetical protein
MRTERGTELETRDFSLEGGCILCGGNLEVRVGPSGARTCCTTCRWLSSPHMQKGEDGVHVIHPAGLIA